MFLHLHLLLPLPVLRRHSDPALCPGRRTPDISPFAVACSPSLNQRTVISTEAAHAFVSSAAEKSASLTIPSLSQDRAPAVEFVVVFLRRHSARAPAEAEEVRTSAQIPFAKWQWFPSPLSSTGHPFAPVDTTHLYSPKHALIPRSFRPQTSGPEIALSLSIRRGEKCQR